MINLTCILKMFLTPRCIKAKMNVLRQYLNLHVNLPERRFKVLV